MSVIAKTNVTLYGETGLDETAKHVIDFKTREIRDAYFDGLRDKITIEDCAYNKIQNNLRIENKNLGDIREIDYYILQRMTYVSFTVDNKKMFAFVTDVTLLNETVTQISIMLDYWTTYCGEFRIGNSQIIRQHYNRYNSEGKVTFLREISEDTASSFYEIEYLDDLNVVETITNKKKEMYPSLYILYNDRNTKETSIIIIPYGATSEQYEHYSGSRHSILRNNEIINIQEILREDKLNIIADELISIKIVYFDPIVNLYKDGDVLKLVLPSNFEFKTIPWNRHDALHSYDILAPAFKVTYDKLPNIRHYKLQNQLPLPNGDEIALYRNPYRFYSLIRDDGDTIDFSDKFILFDKQEIFLNTMIKVDTSNITQLFSISDKTFVDDARINNLTEFICPDITIFTDKWNNYKALERDRDIANIKNDIDLRNKSTHINTVLMGLGGATDTTRTMTQLSFMDGLTNKGFGLNTGLVAASAAGSMVGNELKTHFQNKYDWKSQEIKENYIKSLPLEISKIGHESLIMNGLNKYKFAVRKMNSTAFNIVKERFNRYGYLINEINNPLLNRKYWDYLEVATSQIEGALNGGIKIVIEQILKQGVTIWHLNDTTKKDLIDATTGVLKKNYELNNKEL